jgi:(p)ppGpp synthase/HD superfamily hydrolase
MSVVAAETMTSWEALAEQVARQAHGDTLNHHDGSLYILHPQWVVEYLRRRGSSDIRLAIAWLHDVVEDTDVTLPDLLDLGFPDQIVLAVDALTHRKGERRTDYYLRIGPVLDALVVKLADLRHNTDPSRREGLPPLTVTRLDMKYTEAHRELNPWIIYHLENPA